jgi:hypothetical protein
MWTKDVEYIATVNGCNVGTFRDMNQAYNEAVRAALGGLGGPNHVDGHPKQVEVRENRNYTVVTSTLLY